ncbi:hypothetical protein BAE44_0025407 [Dichanthelium oligosanthes]|uniref:MADS-box domain-containing protein n=1 Tax=Dichanthelium oligosanthes TaxID=888268 RepID=A0A1E5UL18_9POAL|nr:hypothetical protein BAE44_0025407 [Dichanthelium oligosanthes]
MKKIARQAAFRKRRATLIRKAKELSTLCKVPAAVVVYGRGETEPKVWPGVQEVTEVLQRYRDLPAALKEARKLDNEGFMRRRTQKMKRKLDNCKASARALDVNLIINDISLGRPRKFDDLSPELAAAVVSTLGTLRAVTADRVKFLSSEGAQAALPPPLEESLALMALQEPPMVPPLAMAAPMVANAPLVQPAPTQSALVVAPPPPHEEPPMVPPLAMALTVADAPLLLPAPEPEPQAIAAGVGVDEPLNLDFEPRSGSFLLEMADAIVDDGSGRQATAEDVVRLLREHGLGCFKPM